MRDYSLSSTSTPDINRVKIYITGTCTGRGLSYVQTCRLSRSTFSALKYLTGSLISHVGISIGVDH